jgi:hypothetical protein
VQKRPENGAFPFNASLEEKPMGTNPTHQNVPADRDRELRERDTTGEQTGKKPANPVEGEGSYTATRAYNKDTKDFIDRKGKEIPEMARKAADALDSKEGDELRRAEEIGKTPARD